MRGRGRTQECFSLTQASDAPPSPLWHQEAADTPSGPRVFTARHPTSPSLTFFSCQVRQYRRWTANFLSLGTFIQAEVAGTPVHPSKSLRRPVTPLPYSQSFSGSEFPHPRGWGQGRKEGQLRWDSRPVRTGARVDVALLGQLLGLHYPSLGQRGWSGESYCRPRMEISLIYSPRLPQAFVLAFCLLLTTGALGGGVWGGGEVQWFSSCLAELEGACSPIHGALTPPRANPQLLQEERTGDTQGALEDRTGRLPRLLCPP